MQIPTRNRATVKGLRHQKTMNGNSLDRPSLAPHGVPSGPSELEQLAGTRVILIDDEPGVLRALSLVLQALKCTVKPCNKPGEGVTHLTESILSGERWDAILCDLRMPGMSGLDVLSAVRATGSHIPFILMSGHATAADIEESAALGADGFLPKPFSPGQLAGEIARLKRRTIVR